MTKTTTLTKPRQVSVPPRFVPGEYGPVHIAVSPGQTPLFGDRAKALELLELAREGERIALALRKAAETRAEAALADLRTESARHALAAEVADDLARLLGLEPDEALPDSGSCAAEASQAPAELAQADEAHAKPDGLDEPDLARAKPGEALAQPDGGHPDVLDGI